MHKTITKEEADMLCCECCKYRHDTNIYCKQELDCMYVGGAKNMLTVDDEKYIISNRKEGKQMEEKTKVTKENIIDDPCEYCVNVLCTSDWCYEEKECINAGGVVEAFEFNKSKYVLMDCEESQMETDMVNHPKHYSDCSLECIDIMVLMFGAEHVAMHCVITAYKYMHRYKSKNGIEDLNKARWYLDKHLELCETYELNRYKNYEEMETILYCEKVKADGK